jgi:uncharacterized protein DUF6627
MLRSMRLRKGVTKLVSACLVFMGLQVSAVQAAMVSTQSQIQFEQFNYDRDQLLKAVQKQEVTDVLLSWGVEPQDVESRVQSMTPAEVAEFNQQLSEMPAGEGVVGLVVLVFVVLIALDLLGTTNIFPVIKPIR